MQAGVGGVGGGAKVIMSPPALSCGGPSAEEVLTNRPEEYFSGRQEGRAAGTERSKLFFRITRGDTAVAAVGLLARFREGSRVAAEWRATSLGPRRAETPACV